MIRRSQNLRSATNSARASPESSDESAVLAPDSFASESVDNSVDSVDFHITSYQSENMDNLSLIDSLDDTNVDRELLRINQFVANMENNLAEIGLPYGSASTPRIVNARRTSTHPVVATIDLSNLELAPTSHLARVRASDSVIDLCTPPRRLPDFIDLSETEETAPRPVLTRRNVENTFSPPKRARTEDTSITGDGYKCPVCFESAAPKEPSTTKCGHVFCKTCIETAVRTNHKCPLCNKKTTLKQITRIYL